MLEQIAALSHTTIQAFLMRFKISCTRLVIPYQNSAIPVSKSYGKSWRVFWNNRVLYKIIDRADDHFSALRGLISQDVSVEDEFVNRKFITNLTQARFGYEQAARSTDLELQFIAEERTIALAKAMCEFLFEEGKLSTARWVIDSLNVDCTELRAELEQRLEKPASGAKKREREREEIKIGDWTQFLIRLHHSTRAIIDGLRVHHQYDRFLVLSFTVCRSDGGFYFHGSVCFLRPA